MGYTYLSLKRYQLSLKQTRGLQKGLEVQHDTSILLAKKKKKVLFFIPAGGDSGFNIQKIGERDCSRLQTPHFGMYLRLERPVGRGTFGTKCYSRLPPEGSRDMLPETVSENSNTYLFSHYGNNTSRLTLVYILYANICDGIKSKHHFKAPEI